MKHILFFFVGLITVSSALAEQYVVPAGRVNFRSSANFSGTGNVLQVLTEGQRMVMNNDHGTHIEATLIPQGTKGFIWKAYLELANTHDFIAPPTEAAVTLPETSLGVPMCGCTNGCRRSSRYGMRTHPISGRRRLHAGCDMAAPNGQAVFAAAAGRVKFAANNDGYGKTIDIEHTSRLRSNNGRMYNNGFTSRYAHLKTILVSRGQQVQKGQKIGLVNTTGSSTGNHLHFEISVNGSTVDPEGFFNAGDISRACGSNGQPAGTGSTSTAQ